MARAPAAHGTLNKVCPAAGLPDGRRALAWAPLIVARGPQGCSEWSPPTLPSGQGPSGASPARGLERRWRPRRHSSRLRACGRLQRGPPNLTPRGVANSRTQARLNFAASLALPVGACWGSLSWAPLHFPRRPFLLSPSLPQEERGSLPRGVGRGHGVWVTFSPLTLFCLLPRVVPRPRRGQRRSSASGFPGAWSGGPPDWSGDRPAFPHRPAAPPGQQRCCRSPHGETQPAGGRGEGVREGPGA